MDACKKQATVAGKSPDMRKTWEHHLERLGFKAESFLL